MKRFAWFGSLLGVLMLLFSAAPAFAQQGARMGYINSQQILAEAPGAAAAQQAFEEDMARYRSEIEQMGQELETLREQYQQQEGTLSAAARQERQQEIQTQFTAYQQRAAELERTAQQRQAELVEPIMEQISTVIEEIRQEGGYAMIFDAAAGVLITADPALDLTDQVLARLQANAE